VTGNTHLRRSLLSGKSISKIFLEGVKIGEAGQTRNLLHVSLEPEATIEEKVSPTISCVSGLRRWTFMVKRLSSGMYPKIKETLDEAFSHLLYTYYIQCGFKSSRRQFHKAYRA
jgi:hypothetical protein